MKKGFKVHFSDERFPALTVMNAGTIMFYVCLNGKIVDSFTRFEFAMRKEVSLEYAEKASLEFLEYLSTHPWLFKTYSHRNI